jgi:hypothetical protein
MFTMGYESIFPTKKVSAARYTYKGHSISHGNYFFGPKCGNKGNGIYMFESTWHAIVNVTIKWGYMYRNRW